jgi:hypothetical protein
VFVIPAKAGIQTRVDWMPTFVGKTKSKLLLSTSVRDTILEALAFEAASKRKQEQRNKCRNKQKLYCE